MLAKLALTLLVVAAQGEAPPQGAGAAFPDPGKCRVVLDDMGKVGFRISDAQALANDVLFALRKRVGMDAAIYEGQLASLLQMKKMLGPEAANDIQEEQIAFLKACVEKAPFRVRVRFFRQKRPRREVIEISCRNAGTPEGRPLEERHFVAKTFKTAREQLGEALPTFCRLVDPPSAEPLPNKPKERWTPPPRRD